MKDNSANYPSSFVGFLSKKIRYTARKIAPQVMKQSATLKTAKFIKVGSIMSVTWPVRARSMALPSAPPPNGGFAVS